MPTLSALDSESLLQYQHWILDDAEAQKWTGADDETFAYHLQYGHIWLASVAEQPVALLLDSPEMETPEQDDVWTVTLIVAPQWRGQGLGRRVLTAYAEGSSHILLAAIHRDHVSSQKAFMAAGFQTFYPPNDEGYAVYRRLPRHQSKE